MYFYIIKNKELRNIRLSRLFSPPRQSEEIKFGLQNPDTTQGYKRSTVFRIFTYLGFFDVKVRRKRKQRKKRVRKETLKKNKNTSLNDEFSI